MRKRILGGALAAVVLIYLAPIGYIGWHTRFAPSQCRAPFLTFLATWPIWQFKPGALHEAIVGWSLRQCDLR